MATEFDLEGFEKDLDETIRKGREAFKGKYQDELNQLLGISREEIDSITPDMTDLQKYDELIEVIKAASRQNLAQAQLKQQIEKLGSVAITIAKRVSSFSGIFA